MSADQPRYIPLKEKKGLQEKIIRANEMMQSCTLCPRECRVNRHEDEKGFCSTGEKAVVSSFAPHFGEEPPLVGTNGSGTIFFTYCNLKCCFCQNYDISIHGEGQQASSGQIASIMLDLQQRGCHNINLVTPSHVVPQFLQALDTAIDHGLRIPIVYNTSGYDRIETLKLLDGVIDIYMPDIKFFNSDIAQKTCQAPDYPEVVKAAVTEMFRQVGTLKMDRSGVAVSGLLVRHLVMPHDWAATRKVMRFLKEEISPDTYVNVMSQYRPMGNAYKIKELSRPVSVEEFHEAKDYARSLGLNLLR